MSRALRPVKLDNFLGMLPELFYVEKLAVGMVQQLADAAPHSRFKNIYGPTVLAIACTLHRWDPPAPLVEREYGS